MFSICAVLASADFEMPNLENVGSILQTLKNTGMLDQFQEKFTQMFIKEKTQKQEEETKDEINFNEDKPPIDTFSFIR